MSKPCGLSACIAPEEVGCRLGEASPEQCVHWLQATDTNAVAVGVGAATASDWARLPWTGNALGALDVGFLTGHIRARTVGLFGAAASGKTSLLGAWYLLLGRDIAPKGLSFAGSLTLEGWENIAASLRWRAKNGPAFPPHTSSGSGRHPGLLHLTMQSGAAKRDILFADAPGEWFSRWAVRRDADDASGARWLADAADVLVVTADSETLSGPKQGLARSNLLELLRRVGAERRRRPAALVWTKSDVPVDAQMRQAVTKAADNALGQYLTFNVSMRSTPGQEPGNRGQGLLELFEWVTSVQEAGFLKPAAPEPELELLRVVGGVHAY